MSLEAIKTISEAEESVRRLKQEAAQAAKRAIADAEESGRRAIADAAAKAEAELADLRKQAVDKARQEAMELARTTENRKAAMMVKADTRAARAVELVVERIVKS